MAIITDEYGNVTNRDMWPFSRDPRSPNRPPFKMQPPPVVVTRDQLRRPVIVRPFQPGDSLHSLQATNPQAVTYAQAYRSRQRGIGIPVPMPIAPPRGPTRIGRMQPGPRPQTGRM